MKWIKSVVYFSELPDSMRLSPYRRDKRGSWIFALGLVAYEKFLETAVCMRSVFWVRSSGFPAAVPKVVAKPAT